MGVMSRMVKQCRKPSGWFGRLTAWGMNVGHSEMTDWGLRHVCIEKHHTILDVGCGGGRTVRKLASIAVDGKVYGIDYSEESVAVSRRTNRKLIRAGRVEIRHGSVSCLPFSDDVFDLATAVETHYFWPDLVSDMREVLRVLKPGGKLVVIGEAYKGGKHEARNQRWVELGDMAYHTIDELGKLFSTAGYADVQVFEDYDRGWLCVIGEKHS
jgi:ubiquinone/menaquinone biosynthesis C-methylase UbiE